MDNFWKWNVLDVVWNWCNVNERYVFENIIILLVAVRGYQWPVVRRWCLSHHSSMACRVSNVVCCSMRCHIIFPRHLWWSELEKCWRNFHVSENFLNKEVKEILNAHGGNCISRELLRWSHHCFINIGCHWSYETIVLQLKDTVNSGCYMRDIILSFQEWYS